MNQSDKWFVSFCISVILNNKPEGSALGVIANTLIFYGISNFFSLVFQSIGLDQKR